MLAAIIIVAWAWLVDATTFRPIWRQTIGDGLLMVITLLAVLFAGIESGILTVVAAALLLFIRRTSKPHVAFVGRLGNSGIYRIDPRHTASTCPSAIASRVAENEYFANAKVLEIPSCNRRPNIWSAQV